MIFTENGIILFLQEKHIDLFSLFMRNYLISGDKDFGGLVEFGTLWGRGKVILLRYRIININRIVANILEVLNREAEVFRTEKSVVVVLSEGGYRIHKAGKLRK